MAETYPDLTYSEIRSTRVHQHVLNSDAHWQRYAIDIHLKKQERSDLIDSNHLRLTIVSCKSQARAADDTKQWLPDFLGVLSSWS